MNPLAWVVDALKTHPEPVSLPDALVEASPLELAEARSRLQQIGQVANELRKLIDVELAGALQGSALNYGGSIIRSANGRGSAKVVDPEAWWGFVASALGGIGPRQRAEVLAALYPASAVRLTAIPKLAAITEDSIDPDVIKDTFIAYDPPTSPLSVMPIDKAPKYLHDLAEGEIR